MRATATDIDRETSLVEMRGTLARVWTGTGVAFATFVPFAFVNGRPVLPWLVAIDVATSLGLLVSAGWLRRSRWSLERLHAAGYALVGYCAAHAIMATLVFHDPVDASFTVFLQLGIGAVAYDVGPAVALMLAIAVGTVGATYSVAGARPMIGSLVWMLTSIVVGLAVLAGRRAAMSQTTALRQAERARSVELAAALETLERELHDRQRAEVERESMAEQLRQTQKLEAIGTLAGGIAHDLNNVLAAVSGVAEVALDDQPVGSQAHQDLESILTSARRGASLTTNLLGFARRGKHRHERFALEPVVAEVLALLGRTAKKSVRFTFESRAPHAEIVGDPGQVSQALMNLCLNAIDAIEGEGTVAIRLEPVSLGPGESALLPGGGSFVELSVTDDGRGMDPQTLSRAFEPFFSSKTSTGKNSGLGLAMTYGTMRDHEGEALLRSQPGAGTTAILRFPVPAGPAPVSTPSPLARDVPSAGCALVIDDEDGVRAAVLRQLQSSGLRTVEATGGAEGVAAFRATPDAFSVVVLDLAMPGMNGAECFRRLRAIDPEVPVVLVSGYPRDQDVESLLAQGGAAFLSKPFGRPDLLALVAKHQRPAPGSGATLEPRRESGPPPLL